MTAEGRCPASKEKRCVAVRGSNHPMHAEKAGRLCAGCLAFVIFASLLFTGCSENDIDLDDAQAMVEELNAEGYVPDDWVYVGCRYPAARFLDYSNIYMAYIDEEMYESHKSYWLEGVDQDSLYPGYEPEEPENVFHIVHIQADADGSIAAYVSMNGTYYQYVDRMETNYVKAGSDWIVYTKLETAGSVPVAEFRIKRKLFGGYSAELISGLGGDTSMSEEEVKELMHDKKWTENFYDINPRKTGREIAAAMQEQGLIPAGMRLVYTDGERNVYIPSEFYDSHKSYWLEGTEEKDLYEGINADLQESGDRVYWEIMVTGISRRSEPLERFGITFQPDTSYYCAQIYPDILFYRTIRHYDWDGPHAFTWNDVEAVTAGDSMQEDALRTYWCHYEDGSLVIEEAAEE